MTLQQLMQDDDAVSPVIGVILMVAITVILAAVIASFVLGLGPDTATTPTATFSSDYDSTDDVLTITMESGETLNPDNLQFKGDVAGGASGASPTVDAENEYWNEASASEVTAGTSITVGTNGDDYTIRLIYEDGDTTSTMQTFEG